MSVYPFLYHGHSHVIYPDPSFVLFMSYNLNEWFICRYTWVDRHTRERRHRKWRVHLIWQDGCLREGAVHLAAQLQVRYGLHKAGLGLLEDPFHFPFRFWSSRVNSVLPFWNLWRAQKKSLFVAKKYIWRKFTTDKYIVTEIILVFVPVNQS